MGSSAPLDKSPRANWVEKAGGLPPYVREIARSIAKGGKDLAHAIAIALSRIKVWAAGKGVTAKTQAKATEALAQWEKTRAKNATTKIAASATDDGLGWDPFVLTSADVAFLEASAAAVVWSAGEEMLLRLAMEEFVSSTDEVLALAQSKHTRTDGKPSNAPGSTKKFDSSEWKTASAGMKCSRWQHGDNPPPAVAYRTVNGKKMGACATHKKEMTSVKASAGEQALDLIALAASGASGSQPTKSKGSGDGSGKHDLVFFENRSTPKVLSRGQQLGDYPDSYGKVTKRTQASAEDEKKIANGDWLQKDQSGNKPSDSGYKKTKVRPGLVSK